MRVECLATMGAVLDEFRRSLDHLSRRFAGDPAGELDALLLLALEREQIVSIAYRDSLISERLDRMRVAPEIARVARHALLWGALFVPEMDPDAFPLLEPESVPLAFARRAIRRLVGLHVGDLR